MFLYSYFAEALKRSDLPNPNGSLSASVSPTAMREANEAVTRERGSIQGVTLSSNLSSTCNRQVCLSTQQPSGYSALLQAAGSDIFVCTWNISKPTACTCTHAVDHAKLKTTKIYSQVILVKYSKICTNENFLLYGSYMYTPDFFQLERESPLHHRDSIA